MARIVHAAAAQMGPIARSETREHAVERLIALMREAKGKGAELVVFTELALDHFLSALADRRRGRARSLVRTGHAGAGQRSRCSTKRRNSASASISAMRRSSWRRVPSGASTPSILVDRNGDIIGKYRKVHLPGHAEPQPDRTHQHLEKRYFEPGNLGFGGVARLRRRHRHVHLQRPALARDLPGHGPAGGRDGAARLQHAASTIPGMPTSTA